MPRKPDEVQNTNLDSEIIDALQPVCKNIKKYLSRGNCSNLDQCSKAIVQLSVIDIIDSKPDMYNPGGYIQKVAKRKANKYVKACQPCNNTTESFDDDDLKKIFLIEIKTSTPSPEIQYHTVILLKEFLHKIADDDEREIFQYIREGYSSDEISELLGISEEAFRKRKQRLKEKWINFKNRKYSLP
ncbi:MAG TPA: sigma-70 family RNA polymerase sigma factor [Pyrinomonadaceae bacterium]|jgi:RNA polymerase sigma factor (sigma-70 family)